MGHRSFDHHGRVPVGYHVHHVDIVEFAGLREFSIAFPSNENSIVPPTHTFNFACSKAINVNMVYAGAVAPTYGDTPANGLTLNIGNVDLFGVILGAVPSAAGKHG